MKHPWVRICDMSSFCNAGQCCMVLEANRETGDVRIHDPDVPERGQFILTPEEFHRLSVFFKEDCED